MTYSELESIILWKNAEALGIDIVGFYNDVGKEIAERLVSKYGKNKDYSVVCGRGGNAADGLTTAFHLACMDVKKITIYLATRKQSFTNPVVESIFDEILEKSAEFKNLEIKQDCYNTDIEASDIVIEALVGTGLTGDKLNKRFYDIVKRMSHFKAKLVAIDIPSLHYEPDVTYSIFYPKTSNAEVVEIVLPSEIDLFCGPGEKEMLVPTYNSSHKAKNGNLLLIQEDSELNKALENAASEYTTNTKIFNFNPTKKSADSKNEINASEFNEFITKSDAILLGNINDEIIQFATIRHILQNFKDKNIIVSGESLCVVDTEDIKKNANICLIMDKLDFPTFEKKNDSSKSPPEAKIRKFCMAYGVNAILIGRSLSLFSYFGGIKIVENKNTADKNFKEKLATKVATYATKNELWLSMRAGVV